MDSKEAFSPEKTDLRKSPAEEAIIRQYQAVYAELTDAKCRQRDRLAIRLEQSKQFLAARKAQLKNEEPGLISMPGTRADWKGKLSSLVIRQQQLALRLAVIQHARSPYKLAEYVTNRLVFSHNALATAYKSVLGQLLEDQMAGRANSWPRTCPS